MEENTSKAYVGPAAGLLLSGQLAAANGTGSALFVINLCASMAPVPLAGKTLPGLDSYRLYQVSRVEDGRTRYRLRLGFFPSESEAESVLASVRERYPTAFCACLGDEDRKFARGYLPDSASLSDTQIQKRTVSLVPNAPRPAAAPSPAPVAAQPAPLPAAAPAKPQAVAKPAAVPAAKPAAPAPVPVAQAAPVAPPTKAPTPDPVAKAVTAAPAAKPAAPVSPPNVAPVAKAAAPVVDDSEIEITWEPETPARKPAQAAAASSAQSAIKTPAAAIEAAGDEIEISWEPPSLTAAPANQSSGSTSVTIAPVFATDTVIKAKPEVKAPPAAVAKPAAPAASIAAAKPAAPPAPAVVAKPAAAKAAAPIELTLAAESHPAAHQEAAASKPAATPFHVGKGVEIPAVSLSLDESQAPAAKHEPSVEASAQKAAAASKPAAKPAVVAPKEPPKREPVAAISKPVAAPPATPAVASAPPVSRPISLSLGIAASASAPELDSTQTIRALTNDELNDAAQEKWFSIQLAVSEQPVNLDAMPHLDIFEAYRLYSVASAGSGKIVHSLRLGFFREAVSADAVGGYLKTFFPNPSVVRISIAEQLRFKDAPAPKPAKAEPKAESKIIDLSDARRAKPVVPTVTMEVATPRQGSTSDRSPTGMHKLSATGTFKLNATGAHKLDATGTHKLDATGSNKLTSTGIHKVNSSGPHKLSATGTHKALKSAAKNGGPATRHSSSKSSKTSATGKFRAVGKKSLTDQLLDEAREVELSESAIRRLPKNDSLLSRLVDKLKK